MAASADVVTSLRNACIDGKLEVVRDCLAKGADPNSRMATGNLNTPLHNACARGNEFVVELLISNGADLEAKNKMGETPLHMAINHRFLNLIRILVEQNKVDLAEPDIQGNAALHKAAIAADRRIVEYLIARGADPDEVNEDGKRPIEMARSDEARAGFSGAQISLLQ